ncbi:hypothetical protein CHL76_04185 [Marinococcus halophilus]|uniref:Uncharacterized protein n=1 Tax=Marinococcus halophilus TaxID=1371 RepID=A0A510Y7M5_MARHA|nr:hypothetical protein [Marinococcus halophilus]OZT80986.1 hypothetical protein CHL76_04185 [Marinococcus halophilus]GEK59369.1 hypothetical protein MHA01_22740 [Marinococcus halophilus]
MISVEKPSALNRARKKKVEAMKAEGDFASQLKTILVFSTSISTQLTKWTTAFARKKLFLLLPGKKCP